MEPLVSAPTHDRGDRLLRVAWATRRWGRNLLLVALAGAAVPLVVRALDGGPWGLPGLLAELLVPAAAAWVAAALLRDLTELRVAPGGAVTVRHGPVPFFPGARFAAGEVVGISTFSLRWKRRWRVDLVTRDRGRHPVCFGGVETAELAERTAEQVREFLRLPASAPRPRAGLR